MSAPTHNGNGFTGAPLAPPQNLEAEQSVLGAVLLSDTTLPALIIDERLTPDDFYRESHGRIYQAMLDLNTQGEPVDALTLVEHLKQAGDLESVGGAAAIELLSGSVPAVGNVRQYARIVRDNAMLRRLLHASYEIQAQVHGHEALPRELVDRAERLILEVAHEDSRKDFRSIEQVLDFELDKLQKLSLEGTPITGTPVRLRGPGRDHRRLPARQPDHPRRPPVDGQVGVHGQPRRERRAELQQGRRAVLAGDVRGRARPALHRLPGVDQGRRPAQGPRPAGALGQDPRRLLAAGRVEALHRRLVGPVSVLDVRAKCRRLAQQNADGLGLVLIDYLQLMRAGSGGPENRVEQIGQISRGLKTLARELEVPVIALSQLNRGVEQRKPPIPMLSDLRESGSIEQDADLVMFIFREDYYDKESEREGIADLIISKHRNGGLGTVELTFQRDFPRFMSYAGDDRY